MLKLILCVAGEDEESRELFNRLALSLSESLPPDSWQLDVVDVIQMPDIALQHDVFATPMLLRELPEPVIKLIGAIAESPRVVALMLQGGQDGHTLTV